MNHRLKFRYDPNVPGGLELVDVWCPGDHGGECDCPEVDGEDHDDECAFRVTIVAAGADPETLTISAADLADADFDDCDCQGRRTGRCWAKENLELFVGESDGWGETLRGAIDLPWVAVTIDGPGPDGNDELFVNVIAEVEG